MGSVWRGPGKERFANVNYRRALLLFQSARTCLGQEVEFDAYVALVILAATQHRIGQVKAAKQSEAIAETGYSTLQRYLSDPARAGYLTGRQRGDLDRKMKMFREALDGL